MPRVLVVDDEPRITSFVSRALSAEGFGVDAAHDGIRALDLARNGVYELVVLDLLLPGMDGLSVLRGIMESRPEQRVVVLSALSDVDSKVRCLELGASDYLPSRSPWRSSWPGSGPDCASPPAVRPIDSW